MKNFFLINHIGKKHYPRQSAIIIQYFIFTLSPVEGTTTTNQQVHHQKRVSNGPSEVRIFLISHIRRSLIHANQQLSYNISSSVERTATEHSTSGPTHTNKPSTIQRLPAIPTAGDITRDR
ncbi:hypothetical protein JTE90_003796 [Oedothorax gibbosus]|uniref:Uncharacterized protein n=1 Tax=Oedothorax gibbosus TaxID=931172 RepID=A0AAV6VAH7_9ARAC|nr:hypothetical protein JTE90_003796 [Oedothorax gibbosus]